MFTTLARVCTSRRHRQPTTQPTNVQPRKTLITATEPTFGSCRTCATIAEMKIDTDDDERQDDATDVRASARRARHDWPSGAARRSDARRARANRRSRRRHAPGRPANDRRSGEDRERGSHRGSRTGRWARRRSAPRFPRASGSSWSSFPASRQIRFAGSWYRAITWRRPRGSFIRTG